MGGEAHLARGRRRRRPGVGPGLGHQERPRAMGGRAAQHVEAYGAGGGMVSRGEFDAEPALLAVSGAAVEGADGANARPSLILRFVLELGVDSAADFGSRDGEWP